MTLLGIAGAYLEDSTNEKHFWPKDSKNSSEGYSLWPSLDPPQDSSDGWRMRTLVSLAGSAGPQEPECQVREELDLRSPSASQDQCILMWTRRKLYETTSAGLPHQSGPSVLSLRSPSHPLLGNLWSMEL